MLRVLCFKYAITQNANLEPYDLLEVGHHPVKEEWRSVTTTSGALSVMTHGTVWMPVLLACTLATAMMVHCTKYLHCA